MARPTTISDDLILEAARDVFLEHGIRGTTAEVASRAGVSEGIVFKRFKSKEELFRKAMTTQPMDALGWIAMLPARVGKSTLRAQLFEIGMGAASFFERIVALHMHAFASRRPGDARPPFGDFAEPPPLTARKRMITYLEAERALGRLAGDPDLLSRAFLGALYSFVALDLMMAGHDPEPMAKADFVRGLVDTLLDGAGGPVPPAPRPRGGSTRPRRPSR